MNLAVSGDYAMRLILFKSVLVGRFLSRLVVEKGVVLPLPGGVGGPGSPLSLFAPVEEGHSF